MSSKSWGYLLLPGIKNWTLVNYPHVFDEVMIEENKAKEAVCFAFHNHQTNLWLVFEIDNEVFYDSPTPYLDIVAIIQGKFAELLKSGLKAEYKAAYQITPSVWTTETIKELLTDFLGPILKFLSVTAMPGDKFKIVVQIEPLSVHGQTNNSWVTSKKWLEKSGEGKLLEWIKNGLGLGTYKGHIYKKPQQGYIDDFLVTQEVIDDDLYKYTATAMLSMLEAKYQSVKAYHRQGQFYEVDDKWIPVGLTLADVT